ncbi:hypothetical protein NQ317_013942 [Molorchus minor]|uniref:Uncharacterized protein n=1 Tax=Molorchus minor TaxID=1323400 RepID=A0ABQ9JWS2_9CUCU|nr:hypothetical protein NQ317_013942 [Molorchus minor]
MEYLLLLGRFFICHREWFYPLDLIKQVNCIHSSVIIPTRSKLVLMQTSHLNLHMPLFFRINVIIVILVVFEFKFILICKVKQRKHTLHFKFAPDYRRRISEDNAPCLFTYFILFASRKYVFLPGRITFTSTILPAADHVFANLEHCAAVVNTTEHY